MVYVPPTPGYWVPLGSLGVRNRRFVAVPPPLVYLPRDLVQTPQAVAHGGGWYGKGGDVHADQSGNVGEGMGLGVGDGVPPGWMRGCCEMR